LLKKDLFPEAIAELKKAVQIDSSYESAVYNLASAHINWGVKIKKEAGEDQTKKSDAQAHFLEAIPHLQKVIELRPNNADMYEVLGRLQTNLGMSKEAEVSFKKADDIRKKK
jgi:tetratricopeptide (TPR) repeat protein